MTACILAVASLLAVILSSCTGMVPSDPSPLYDDFRRGDGLPDASPIGGYKYVQIPPSRPGSNVRLATIVGHDLVAPPFAQGQTLVATYTGIDFLRTPRTVRARVKFTDDGAGGNVTLISSAGGNRAVEDITGGRNAARGSLHVVFSNVRTYAQYFEGGKLMTVQTFTYPKIVDDNIVHDLGWTYRGSGAFDLFLPDGRTVSVTSNEMASKLGRYIIFEHYYRKDQARTSFVSISAE